MAYNIQPISLEQTIAALRGGGDRTANAIEAGQAGVAQSQAAELEKRKAALAQRIQEAGIFKGSELGQLPEQAGLSLAPGREVSRDLVSDIMTRTAPKEKSEGLGTYTRDQLLNISANLPTAGQALFLAGAEGLPKDKAFNAALRNAGIYGPLALATEKKDYQQNTDPARLKTNMFARQSSTGNDILNTLDEKYGSGLVDQFPMFDQLKSEDRKKFDQGVELFANSILRPETGAVINASEYKGVKQRYIPLPGDSAGVRQQKRAAREEMVQLLNAVRGGDPDAIARLAEMPEAAANKAIRAKREKNKSQLERIMQPADQEPVVAPDGIAPEDAEYFQ